MFAEIAGRYDCANHLLSGGLDFFWRRSLAKAVKGKAPSIVLDLATGSGDVAIALAGALPESTEIIGMDFCKPMLELAEAKKRRRGISDNLRFIHGDCLEIPMADNSVDAVTIAFGLRNLDDRTGGLREMLRVLRTGGTLFVLEFSQPDPWLGPIFNLYLRYALPRIAGIATGHPEAYHYLAASIGDFPPRSMLADEIRGSGYSQVDARKLAFSIVAIHEATP